MKPVIALNHAESLRQFTRDILLPDYYRIDYWIWYNDINCDKTYHLDYARVNLSSSEVVFVKPAIAQNLIWIKMDSKGWGYLFAQYWLWNNNLECYRRYVASRVHKWVFNPRYPLLHVHNVIFCSVFEGIKNLTGSSNRYKSDWVEHVADTEK